MNLAQTQAQLFRAIAEGRDEGIEGIVEPSARLSPQKRVEIYAEMYFWRQVDALREDFPKLAALLGEEEFTHLVEGYVQAYPSEHPSLGKLGRRLAHFISERGGDHVRPDLAELAALEWARAEVFVEADAPCSPGAVFTQLPPERFAQAKCRMSPAIRVLCLPRDPIPLWHALENGDELPEPISVQQQILVWRKGWAVYHAAVDVEEARALERAREGRTLGEICEAFGERDEPAAAAFAALQSWVGEGLVASVEPG
ncbi:MAG TPA: putative DNA-binding domain-containing protein [Myxococcaceae bacterium]|nr:putative DNA-binding domain-containing protein [Myxococcaceae bacterium]